VRTYAKLHLAALACLAFHAAPALADDKAVCLDAFSQGQILRNAHQLVEAREQFKACARAGCPAVVQRNCATWVSELDRIVPTVVLSAKDAAGNDVFDVNVSVDGVALTHRLDGGAIPMNPGPHAFRFQRSDGAEVDRSVLVLEGQATMLVAITFAAVAPLPPAAPTARPAAGATPAAAAEPSGPAHGGAPWHTAGWIAGGAGVVGLGVGSAFGLIAISKKNAAQCDPAGVCTNYGAVSDAKNAGTVADVGFVAGGVLLACGAALLLFTHSSAEAPADGQGATLVAAPMITASGAGALLQGNW
jgi:hypothetical protein